MQQPQAWEHVNLNAALADMKDRHYQLLLSYGSLLDILVEKGLVTHEELADKASMLDAMPLQVISSPQHPKR